MQAAGRDSQRGGVIRHSNAKQMVASREQAVLEVLLILRQQQGTQEKRSFV